MADILRNLIQYEGIADEIPENANVFKQLNVEKVFCLPDAKPDIEQIIKVISELIIKNTKVIRTPKGTSLEGQELTGWKVVVEGAIKVKFQYVADVPEQSVHAAHTEVSFSTYIVLPESFISGTPVTVRGSIEDVFVNKMDERCIFINVTILLTADFC